jgi:hypothetical protein
VVRIALWLLAIIVGLPVALLSAACVWIYLATNWHPPAQFARLFSPEHLTHPGEVDKAITEILNTEFPVGTPVSDLKSALYKRGFRDLPPPPIGCVPPPATEGLRPPYTICPDNRNIMAYKWAIGLVCGGNIYVSWSPDQNAKITSIKTSAYTECL